MVIVFEFNSEKEEFDELKLVESFNLLEPLRLYHIADIYPSVIMWYDSALLKYHNPM